MYQSRDSLFCHRRARTDFPFGSSRLFLRWSQCAELRPKVICTAHGVVFHNKMTEYQANLPTGEHCVTIQRPDGSTYPASFGGKIWPRIGLNGEDLPIIGWRTRLGQWSHGVLGEGEKIVTTEATVSIHRDCPSVVTSGAAETERTHG